MQLRITEAAARSIIEQADYYQHASDASLSQRWEVAVDAALRSLQRLPGRGAPCRFHAPALAGMRWISIPDFPRHMIFYRHSSAERTILIVQVLHGARNLQQILKDAQEK
jgi:plasmid stabilization system protein ParE